MGKVFDETFKFKNRYSKTIAFRIKAHASVIEKHLNPDEEVIYAFCAQKNRSSLKIINSCVIALTNKRVIIAQKRLFWGYFFTTITPDLYDDLKVRKNMIWSDI